MQQYFKTFFLFLCFIFLYGCGHKQTEKKRPVAFPYDRAEVAFQEFLSDTSVFGNIFSSIDSGSIELIDNDILRQEMPHFDFYFMFYYRGQHLEYNGGKIPTVFANPKQKNVRTAILMPFDYTDGQEDFCKLFCNRPFGNKRDKVCIAICDLFMRTNVKSWGKL